MSSDSTGAAPTRWTRLTIAPRIEQSELSPDHVYGRQSLTLRRNGTKLEIFLALRGRDGVVREEPFVFEQVP